MVDATTASKYPWIWDHTSNMREYMMNPHALSNTNDQPRHVRFILITSFSVPDR